MMSDKVNIKINGINLEVEKGTTILNAAKLVNADIPTLCHMDLEGFGFVNRTASCRVCMVEVEGRQPLAPSCSITCSELNPQRLSRKAYSKRQRS